MHTGETNNLVKLTCERVYQCHIFIGILTVNAKEYGVIPLLMQEKKQVDKATENMLKAIEQGVITETTAKRLKELEAKQKEIEAKILIEQSKSIVRISASDIRKYYKDALRYEARALINYLVKEIILYDDKMEIYFTKPTRNGPDENRGFSFCLNTTQSSMEK